VKGKREKGAHSFPLSPFPIYYFRMFLDQATIKVIGGSGGRGCVSWRR